RRADGRPHGARPGRHLGLQLPRLARQLLPRRPAGARDAPLLRARARHRRDQPHLPPPAHAGAAHGLRAPDAGRLPLRVEGRAALCIAEADDFATPPVPTAPFGYLRLRRADYGDADLDRWAARVREVVTWKRVYVYFKHEESGRGPALARAFLARLRDRPET